MLRAIIALLLLGGLVLFLDQEQRAGRFRQVDDGFRDFLIANVRARFVPDLAASGAQVMLVEMRESEAAEYEAWPPLPLDWQMVLEAVAKWQPEVLVIAEPLNWGQPSPPFVPAVGETLQRFPSVVMGVEAAYAETATPAFLGGLESRFPHYPNVAGAVAGGSLWLKALVVPPDERLRPQVELGLLAMPKWRNGVSRIPYAVQVEAADGSASWLPTLMGQTMSRVARSPYALQRLRLGAGAGVHLEGGRFVPLTAEGEIEWTVVPGGGVTVVSALDLLSGGIAELLPPETVALAQQAKVVVVGIQRGESRDLAKQAEALAAMLAVPTLQQLPVLGQWGVWAVAGLLGVHLARRRTGALWRTFMLVLAGFGLSFLLFQSKLIWFPPTIPAALLLAGGVWGRLTGKGRPVLEQHANESAQMEDATKSESVEAASFRRK